MILTASKNFKSISFEIENYMKAGVSPDKYIPSIGFIYFSPIKGIDEIIEELTPYFIQNDYLTIIQKMNEYCAKMIYQGKKELDEKEWNLVFSSAESIFYKTDVDDIEQKNTICDMCHKWVLTTLEKFNYSY